MSNTVQADVRIQPVHDRLDLADCRPNRAFRGSARDLENAQADAVNDSPELAPEQATQNLQAKAVRAIKLAVAEPLKEAKVILT
jgi:hypothetical protein